MKLELENKEEKEKQSKDQKNVPANNQNIKVSSNPPKNNTNHDQIRKRMLMIFGIVLGVVLLILLILFILSLFIKKEYSYVEIENIMKNAAVRYYDAHKGRLPKSNDTVEAVDEDILVRNEYMKPLSEYLKEGVHCLGKVEVDYNGGDYIYTPYLECGKAYSTTEFYKEVTKKENVVTSGYGLYNMNNEYVYRGENVKNYIALDEEAENLWRIVKITATGEAVLIKDMVGEATDWDNRFNTDRKYNTGINDYTLSRMKDYLADIYYSNDEYEKVLTEKARKKLVTFDLCVGKRAKTETANDNSKECAVTEKSQRIGLLTASDYLNASLDSKCTSLMSKSCQNYNYLKINYNWWLITANPENSYQVYRVSQSGYIESMNASNDQKVRPVVHLSNKAMYKSGKGTKKDPYKIR